MSCKVTVFNKTMRTASLLIALVICHAKSEGLSEVIKQVTPSVVAIGLYTPIENSGNQVLGTGFVVGDGKHVVTNYHVVSKILDPQIVQYYVVVTGQGRQITAFKAEILEIDPLHDLALLRFEGKLTSAVLSSGKMVEPGFDVAFTGFPIGAAIGLYPATHRGMVSAITPDAIPVQNSNKLTATMLNRLRKPELVYQLDATAYPGNSGSPVYDVGSGEVVGVINKVFVSQGKESALSAPSGISYAIPVRHVLKLMEKQNL
ncbi:S1 family peptidase [Alteromonas hispanica]|uniref:Trypsin-like serine protease n=1 Tax=Alteromonas hispanica TaxID=315421 RepID=A0A6L9MUU4_9ALTE|nr:serine protease [Alteromonas hispanica]NDW21591.1 trypsin-like serine protease [Alteromonas hispanica]